MSTQDIKTSGSQIPVRRFNTAAAASAMTFKDIVTMLRRRVFLIVTITVLCALVSVVMWYLFKSYSPLYTSVGYIRCKMPVQNSLFQSQTILPRTDIIEMETAARATILNSDYFLTRVLGRGRVQGTKWYASQNKNRLLESLKKAFSARPIQGQDLVQVSMRAGDPSEAKLILDEALQEFEKMMQDEANSRLNDNLASLKKELNDQLLPKLQAKQRRLLELSKAIDEPGFEQGRTMVMDKLSALNAEKLRLVTLLEQARNNAKALDALRKNHTYSSNVETAVSQDPMVMGLKDQITRLQQQRDTLLSRLGPEHREVKDVDENIKAAQAQLQQREQKLREQYAQQEQQNAIAQVNDLQQQLDYVQTQLDEVSRKQLDIDQTLRSYKATQQEIDGLNKRLEMFNKQINSMRVTLNDPDRVKVEIASLGTKPKERSFPKLSLFLPGGIVIGLMLGIGLAFMLEYMDDSVKSPSDVIRYLQAPFLGMIPGEKQDNNIAIEKICALRPHSMQSEFYRQARTNISYSAPGGEIKTILVTGSSASCGKTTIAVNLAISFTDEQKRVLLIDANFHRPAIKRLFPPSDGGQVSGLSEYLTGKVKQEEIILPSGIHNMDVIYSGKLPPSPADLLNTDRMREFLAQQKEKYDYIILDGPPMLIVVDARILSALVDGTIAVIRAASTSRGMEQRMMRELQSAKGHLLGVLLNDVKPQKGGYFEEVYRTYNEYVGMEEKQA